MQQRDIEANVIISDTNFRIIQVSDFFGSSLIRESVYDDPHNKDEITHRQVYITSEELPKLIKHLIMIYRNHRIK